MDVLIKPALKAYCVSVVKDWGITDEETIKERLGDILREAVERMRKLSEEVLAGTPLGKAIVREVAREIYRDIAGVYPIE